MHEALDGPGPSVAEPSAVSNASDASDVSGPPDESGWLDESGEPVVSSPRVSLVALGKPAIVAAAEDPITHEKAELSVTATRLE